MKTVISVLSAIVLQVPCGAEEGGKPVDVVAMMSVEKSYEHNLVGKRLLRPIDDELLKRLMAQPEESENHDNILSTWLLRIAAEADRKYLWLLEDEAIQAGGSPAKDEIRDILLIYDYNVNGRQKSLETVLERLREAMKEEESWSVQHLYALSAVNEWNLCRQALGSHPLLCDGSGGDERYGFWIKRRFFFPDNEQFPDDYEAFCRDLEELQAKAGEK